MFLVGYRVSCSYDIPNGRIKWCSGRHCNYECDDDYIATREWLYCEQGYWTDSDGLTGHIYDTDRITKLDKNTFCRGVNEF